MDNQLLIGLLGMGFGQKPQQPAQGLLMNAPPVNKLAGLLGTGLAPYGFRWEESLKAPVSAKGGGYFGPMAHAEGGVATEMSAHNEQGGFPLITPSLNALQLASLLRGDQPTDDVYKKAAAFAAARRSAGMDPFAQPLELRMPRPTK